MKKRIKKRLSFLLLTLLGFSTACEKLKNGETPLDMYGTPHVDIRVQGRVTDKSGNPIPGLQIRDGSNDESRVLTSTDGSYDLSNRNGWYETQLIFKDIDGPANGGEFEAQTLEITFTDADLVPEEEGGNGSSLARTDVDVVLQEKKTETGQ